MKSIFRLRRNEHEVIRNNIKSVLQEFIDIYETHPNFKTDKNDWQAHYDISIKTIEAYRNYDIDSIQNRKSTDFFINNVKDHLETLENVKNHVY